MKHIKYFLAGLLVMLCISLLIWGIALLADDIAHNNLSNTNWVTKIIISTVILLSIYGVGKLLFKRDENGNDPGS